MILLPISLQTMATTVSPRQHEQPVVATMYHFFYVVVTVFNFYFYWLCWLLYRHNIRVKMSGNKFQGHCIDNQVTPTTSVVSSRSSTKEANRRKRCERRIQWDVNNDNNMSLERTSKRRTIHHSVTSTDLTSIIL